MADSQTPISNAEEKGESSSAGNITTDTSTLDAETSASTSAEVPAEKCANCSKVESDPDKPLKPCSKCKTATYCSKDCQKADFKQHKKNCASLAQKYAQTHDSKPVVRAAPPKDAHRGGLQKWQFDT